MNGVKDLTLAVEGFFYDSIYGYAQGNGAQKPAFWFDLKAGYKIDDLNLGLVFYYYSYDKDSGISGYAAWNNKYKGYASDKLATISGQDAIVKYDFSVKPSVNYALAGGKIVPGLAAKIGVGLPEANGGGEKVSTLGIEVNPSIDFVIASGTRIQLGYEFYWRNLSYDGTTQVERTDNAVYLDFLWKF